MNKLNKIFLVIIILLTIALGIITYSYWHWRNEYLQIANKLVFISDAVDKAGFQMMAEDDKPFRLVKK